MNHRYSIQNMDLAVEVTSIENSYDCEKEYESVVDRYYSRRYCLDVCGKGDDYCIMIHSNRVCLVTLAPSHNIIAEGKTVTNLDFKVSNNVDRLSNKVSGKSKHGAQRLKPTSPIVFAECSDGSKYKICSAISGKLIEINMALLANPNLIVEDPQQLGYIAIVLPDIQKTDAYRQNLLTEDDYYEKLKSREHQTGEICNSVT